MKTLFKFQLNEPKLQPALSIKWLLSILFAGLTIVILCSQAFCRQDAIHPTVEKEFGGVVKQWQACNVKSIAGDGLIRRIHNKAVQNSIYFGGTPKRIDTMEVSKSDIGSDSVLISFESNDSPLKLANFCIGRNPSYAFELSKSKGTQARWNLSRYHVGSDRSTDLSSFGFLTNVKRPSREFSLSALMVPGVINIGFLDLANASDWEGVSNVTFTKLEIPLSKLDFEFLTPDKKTCLGTFMLDETISNLPIQMRFRIGDRKLTSMEVDGELVWTFDGPVITSMICKYVSRGFENDNMYEETRGTYEFVYEFGSFPAHEFTLSAFGFPEPSELRRRGWLGISTSVWLIGLAVVLGGSLFYWRSK